jgi:hypothetical protein
VRQAVDGVEGIVGSASEGCGSTRAVLRDCARVVGFLVVGMLAIGEGLIGCLAETQETDEREGRI